MSAHAYHDKTTLSEAKLSDIEVLHYWAGYIHADGGIYTAPRAKPHWKPRVWLQFAQAQLKPVVALQQFLESKGNVSVVKKVTNYGPSTMYVFNTSKNIDFFISQGVKGQLSETLKHSWHFWRGMFDGDGTVSWVKNGGKLYPAIQLGGRLEDMEAFSALAEPVVGMPMKIRPCRSIFTLGRNGSNAVRLVKKLWGDDGQYYSAMPYKREAVQKLIHWKSDHRNSKGRANG